MVQNLKFLTTPVLRIMKFGKIKKLWVALQIWFKLEDFDYPSPPNHKIWQDQEIWVMFKMWLKFKIFNNPSIMWTMKFDKNQKNLSWVEFGSNLWFLTTPGQGTMKFGNIKKFESLWKFGLNLTFFVHPGSGNNKIWQNQDKLSSNLRFLITPSLRTKKFGKIKNFESRWKFGSNLWQNQEIWVAFKNLAKIFNFLTTPVLWIMKFGKIEIFESHLKLGPILLNLWPAGHTNDEIWQYQDIWVMPGDHVENLSQIWDFWSPWSWVTQISKYLSHVENLSQNLRFLITPVLWTIKFGKIKIFEIFEEKKRFKFEIFDHPGPVTIKYCKIKKLGSH